ncbi:transporter substrate-binding protein [Klebsiella pneumoniae subsp. pneumoniae]|nr:transporter substrate-binding protein [Klebsiella pneumoniae subsp. pneumoniae]
MRRWSFGCWTSVSRNRSCRCLRNWNGLLFTCGTITKGKRCPPNVFCYRRGARPNQQAIPAVGIPAERDGGGAETFPFCWGRTTSIRAPPNKILRASCSAKGGSRKDVEEAIPRSGYSDYQTIVVIKNSPPGSRNGSGPTH